VKGLVLTLLVAGCAAVPPPEPAPSLDTIGARTLTDAALPHAPDTPWTRAELTAAALALHPEVRVATLRWEEARAALQVAAQRPNPTVNLGVEYKNETSPWIIGLTSDVTIETSGKRALRVEEARHALAAAAAGVTSTAWGVGAHVREALAAMRSSESRATLLAAEERTQQEIASMLEKRVSVGEAATPELSRARIAALQTSALRAQAEREREQARVALAAALALPADALGNVRIATSFTTTLPPASELRTLALHARSDITTAVEEFRAADAAYRLEVARRNPDVHLGPGLGWDQGAATWSLGVGAELPLFHRREGEIAAARARRDSAGAAILALQSRILTELDSALAARIALQARLEEATRLVAAQRTATDRARRRFAAGESDRLELRTSELELEAAELLRAEAEAELLAAEGRIEAAVQRPLDAPSEELR
jgi:outer membrane protein TolC